MNVLLNPFLKFYIKFLNNFKIIFLELIHLGGDIIVKQYRDSLEAKLGKIRDAVNTKFKPTDPNSYNPYDLYATFDDSIILRNYEDSTYIEVPYTVDADGTVTLGDQVDVDEVYVTKQQVTNSMKHGVPFILINGIDDDSNKVYLWHVQSDKELPAYDMGLDKIQYDPEGIKNGLDGLVGTFVYDESQSAHNRKVNPEMRGRKVGKVVDKLYCNEYGGFAKVEVFDKDFDITMQEVIKNKQQGLPVKEGPSTELFANDGVKYGNNSLRVTDFTMNGLVWTDSPRDKSLGVCDVVTNSITKIKGDETVTDKLEIDREEYDALKEAQTELDELKPKYAKGEELYNDEKADHDKLKLEEADLRNQLVPIWTKQGEEKLEMVNSIIEKVPEAEKEAKREIYDSMTIEQLGEIVNSFPGEGSGSGRGFQGNGGTGRGNGGNDKPVFEDPEKQKKWEAAQNLPSTRSRHFVKKSEEE
jgi:hypothetical protein